MRRAPLASLLAHRPAAAILTGVAALQVGLAVLGIPGWPCPLYSGLGIPCPGCGLSRATVELLHGHWLAALSGHAFAPLLLGAMGLLAGAAVLPARLCRRLAGAVGSLERRTGFSALALGGLLLYWITRLTFEWETLAAFAGRRP